MNKITILVVLYNKHINESETLRSIMQWHEKCRNLISKIIIWNNSDFQLEIEEKELFCSKFKDSCVEFLGDGFNHPLSKIYNEVIRLSDGVGWLILLDHDSNVPESYIREIIEITTLNNCPNLLLPQILYNNQLVSPAKCYLFIGRYLNNIQSGKQPSRHLTAINSGMCINLNYLKNKFVGYNERIKFYGTDNDFMWKYSLDNKELFVMKQKILHTLNFYDNEEEYEKKKHRFDDIKNGMIEFVREINPRFIFLVKVYWIYFSLKFFLSNRS